MTYDDWKTTEPPEECQSCGRSCDCPRDDPEEYQEEFIKGIVAAAQDFSDSDRAFLLSETPIERRQRFDAFGVFAGYPSDAHFRRLAFLAGYESHLEQERVK